MWRRARSRIVLMSVRNGLSFFSAMTAICGCMAHAARPGRSSGDRDEVFRPVRRTPPRVDALTGKPACPDSGLLLVLGLERVAAFLVLFFARSVGVVLVLIVVLLSAVLRAGEDAVKD